MTAVIRRDEPWTVQPGWGIFVDLTPPELVSSRQLRVVRQLVLAALVIVVALCAGGYFFATQQRSGAEDDLARANDQLTAVQHQMRDSKYATLTEIQGLSDQIKTQLASVMRSDVAMDQLVYRIAGSADAGMKIDHASITINNAAAAVGANTSSIDKSSHLRIGTVTLTGTARRLVDVSTFVDRLAKLTGVLDVVPVSNAETDHGVTFNITFGLDDQLLSHRFTAKGGK